MEKYKDVVVSISTNNFSFTETYKRCDIIVSEFNDTVEIYYGGDDTRRDFDIMFDKKDLKMYLTVYGFVYELIKDGDFINIQFHE